MIDLKEAGLRIARQCELIGLNRSSHYAKTKDLEAADYAIMQKIDELFTEHPYCGTRRMSHILKNDGYNIERKGVRYYYRIMGLNSLSVKTH